MSISFGSKILTDAASKGQCVGLKPHLHDSKAVLTPRYVRVFSHSGMSNSATPVDLACQSPLSVEFSRQEYWSGLPFPPPRDLPDPGILPASLASPVLAGIFFTTGPPVPALTLPNTQTGWVDVWVASGKKWSFLGKQQGIWNSRPLGPLVEGKSQQTRHKESWAQR